MHLIWMGLPISRKTCGARRSQPFRRFDYFAAHMMIGGSDPATAALEDRARSKGGSARPSWPNVKAEGNDRHDRPNPAPAPCRGAWSLPRREPSRDHLPSRPGSAAAEDGQAGSTRRAPGARRGGERLIAAAIWPGRGVKSAPDFGVLVSCLGIGRGADLISACQASRCANCAPPSCAPVTFPDMAACFRRSRSCRAPW